MTAPDPRLDEIQARLDAATPGPWEEYWQGHIHAPANYPQAAATSICQTFGREDRVHPNAAFIAHSPADIAYLLAELRKAHEALARVEALVDQAEEDRRVRQDDNPTAMIAYAVVDVDDIRAAVAAANGDGQ